MTRLAWVVLCAGLALSACVPAPYRQPYPVQPVELPRDDAAHAAPIEWWYYTGHFEDPDGREYAFMLTFFKAYTPPAAQMFASIPAYLIADKGHVAHFAITNETDGTHRYAQRADFLGWSGAASSDALDVQVGTWSVRRAADGFGHVLSASFPDLAIDFTLTPTKPAALHGDPPGIQSMGPGGTSYYVSYTRMELQGDLVAGCGILRCDRTPVEGLAWHDHQWGDFDLSSYAGWDWLSLQLDDGWDVMLYLIREPSGAYISQGGSLVTPAGETLPLDAGEASFEPTGETWSSDATGAIYPVAWRLNVPRHGIDVTVRASVLDQEMDTRRTTGIVYWEGAVAAQGSHSGQGFVELTNYDLYPFGRTDAETELIPLRGPFGR